MEPYQQLPYNDGLDSGPPWICFPWACLVNSSHLGWLSLNTRSCLIKCDVDTSSHLGASSRCLDVDGCPQELQPLPLLSLVCALHLWFKIELYLWVFLGFYFDFVQICTRNSDCMSVRRGRASVPLWIRGFFVFPGLNRHCGGVFPCLNGESVARRVSFAVQMKSSFKQIVICDSGLYK